MPPTNLPPPMTASRQRALARLEQRMRNQFGPHRKRNITAKDRRRLIEMARIKETRPQRTITMKLGRIVNAL